ncbi:DEAD/DEAH box helicase [Lichenibacterium dinghuense]|uniref:DEAD/DEAH box helicase n=1 Tax=Lichenibacterium dinghuense TaxID=2895977 RepID=UPI001F313E4C|nr:AAA domain-containing protein [Lichenibacterium sp. 6Y81]
MLVEVIEIIEDERELAIVMLDPGAPLLSSPRSVLARRQLCSTSAGRAMFWRNISRVIEALSHCHDAGIVHGAIDEHAVFARGDDNPNYRLGGYEACVHIADSDPDPSGGALRRSDPISFRRDLADVAGVVNVVLGLDQPGAPILSSIERRMLGRMANPPHHQAYDGHAALEDLTEVIEELGRSGAGIEGEMILYPGAEALRVDLPTLTSGMIPAEDADAVTRFIADDLSSVDVRMIVGPSKGIRIVTDLATYDVQLVEPRIGMITHGAKRRPHDRINEASDVKRRIYLARNRGAAAERVRKLGHGAAVWASTDRDHSVETRGDDPPSWTALLLLEVFSLLKQQFRTFPVDVLTPPRGQADLVWIAPRNDSDRDTRRSVLKLPPMAVALRKEMENDEGRPDWSISQSDWLGRLRDRSPELAFEAAGEIDGRQAYGFRASEPVLPEQHVYLRPRNDAGTDRAIRRRLLNVVAARGNLELLRALDDPATVAMDEALRGVAAPGPPPDDLDASKKTAWASIAEGRSINVVVGPPGVGKTYLIAQLIRSILVGNTGARILVSSQNHETLISIEHELKKRLSSLGKIVIRVEKSQVEEEEAVLRRGTRELLTEALKAESSGPLSGPYQEIRQALRPTDDSERVVAEGVLRDTDNLLLRSSDVTLATTSSFAIEEMIAAGEQFDWVFVEEAARANGSELIGALLLGNRRVMIGDHRQLSPFEASERQKFYEPSSAEELLRDGAFRLTSIPDLPPEIEPTLRRLASDRSFFTDVLAAAARLEEPFRSIAEREEDRENATGRPSAIAQTLVEQSRMHPAICRIVSDTFYGGRLVPSARVSARKPTVGSESGFPTTPVVVLDLPSLSVSSIDEFEKVERKTLANTAEAAALIDALRKLRPSDPSAEPPSLVILAPYTGQVTHIERSIKPMVDVDGRLRGFVPPRADGRFVYTSDSFQGGEADIVLASLVRNNVLVGRRALGFMKNPQRLNVLLSRAKQKFVLATSLSFLLEAVDGTDPDRLGGDLGFIRKLVGDLRRMSAAPSAIAAAEAAILKLDERGIIVR